MTQLRQEVTYTDGKIYVRGRMTARGARKRADYILYFKPNIPIAIVEAKDNNHSINAGIQQALGYADILQIPFVLTVMEMDFYFMTKPSVQAVLKPNWIMTVFQVLKYYGANTKSIRGLKLLKHRKLLNRIIFLMVVEEPHVITNKVL